MALCVAQLKNVNEDTFGLWPAAQDLKLPLTPRGSHDWLSTGLFLAAASPD